MFPEPTTTSGAITGAAIAARTNSAVLAPILGVTLLISLVPTVLKPGKEIPVSPELKGLQAPWANRLYLLTASVVLTLLFGMLTTPFIPPFHV